MTAVEINEIASNLVFEDRDVEAAVAYRLAAKAYHHEGNFQAAAYMDEFAEMCVA